MDGLINFYKPIGITSAKALYRVRTVTGERKSGHAGTLDPAADGVLLLCLGRGTRLVESLMDLPKVYRATARLDVTSESFDSDRPLIPVSIQIIPTRDAVTAACARLVGRIMQVPPAVSAIKLGGTPAYKLCRNGLTPTIPARTVTVYSLDLEAYEWPAITFQVTCGRGTYVRALIRDIGIALGTGGCLTGLTRTRIGPFRIEDSWTLERISAVANRDSGVSEQVNGIEPEFLSSLPRVRALLSSDGVNNSAVNVIR